MYHVSIARRRAQWDRQGDAVMANSGPVYYDERARPDTPYFYTVRGCTGVWIGQRSGERGVDNVCHLQFIGLLYALVRENGKQEFSPRTTISTPEWNLVM